MLQGHVYNFCILWFHDTFGSDVVSCFCPAVSPGHGDKSRSRGVPKQIVFRGT